METTSALPLMSLTALAGNEPAGLNTLQALLAPYSPEIAIFWWFVWWLTALSLVRYVYAHGLRGGDPNDRELYTD